MFCNRIVLAAMIGSGLISTDALAARKCYTLTGNITVQPQVDTCTAMNFAAKFPITNTKDGFYFSAIDGLFDANHQSRCYVGQITGQLTQVNKAKETYDLSGATSYTGLIAGNVGNSPVFPETINSNAGPVGLLVPSASVFVVDNAKATGSRGRLSFKAYSFDLLRVDPQGNDSEQVTVFRTEGSPKIAGATGTLWVKGPLLSPSGANVVGQLCK